MKNQNFNKRLAFALKGVKWAWSSERSFRSQVAITVLVICSLLYFKATLTWWAIFILVIGATLAAELLNTALEHLIDLLHPNYHPSIGKAKDCAAAGVLVLSTSAILIYIFFLVDKFS